MGGTRDWMDPSPNCRCRTIIGMVMSWGAVKGACVEFFPGFLAQRNGALNLDYWLRGEQGIDEAIERTSSGIYVPNPYRQTDEHVDLSTRAYNPWAQLVLDTLAQTMFLDGVRLAGKQDNLQSYQTWQINGWDAKQGSLYRGALGHGISFASAMPGESRLTRKKITKLQAYSAKRCAAWYDEDDDEFPVHVIIADPIQLQNGREGWLVRFVDEEAEYFLECEGDGQELSNWTAIEFREHGSPVPPFVRYGKPDLDGNTVGEIQPVIPILKRLDQDTYDRLIVQRFGAWKVRYITGLVRPKDMSETKYLEGMMKLRLGDFLTSESKDTQFGAIPETQLNGFIAAGDKDLRDLAAVKQMPPHMFTGQAPQMQPESLAAINASLMARSLEYRTAFGQSHEQLFRLAALQEGNRQEAEAFDMQVRWRDTETRSLSQTADALGKIALQLKVPVEMLWERIEGWTDADSMRAKALLEDGSIDRFIAELEKNDMIDVANATRQPAAV